MPPSSSGPVDPIDRAHLTGRSRPSPPIHRYGPSQPLVPLVKRYWVPVWSVPEPQVQRTLQHPACLIVVSNTYARFYGVARGLSTVVLEGDGWAVGTMLTPGAGALVLGGPVTRMTDRYVDLAEISTIDAAGLVAAIRAAMDAAPHDPAAHRACISAIEGRLSALLPLDGTGQLVNDLVSWIQDHPEITRVTDLAAHLGSTERALQRLVLHRVGLTPKWLIQRRRLHDAVERLKSGSVSLAELAAELGYADQAHLTHDFRAVTGMTPGAFLGDQH